MPQPDLARTAALPVPSHIRLGPHAFKPHPSGAIYWEAERTLIVADLHLQKGAVAASRGSLLPPYDTRSTLQALASVIEAFDPARVVALGDSFHTGEAALGLSGGDRMLLAALQEGRNWYWISGNHDPDLPRSLGGVIAAALTIDGVTLRHEPAPHTSSQEIAGHLHPCARVALRGTALRRKCFATDGNRLILPAFGAYTGGLNVLNQAFWPLFEQRALQAWLMGRRGVYVVGARALLPD